MLIGRIEGATRYLGAPVDWKPDEAGTCGHLAIADVPAADGGNWQVSAWMPTPKEIEAIAAGEPVYLYIYGRSHPVVGMGVKGVQS